MQLWLTHGSASSIREQLVTQLRLAIFSGDLKPGDKLPSTRELARRFHIHPNTASAGYRQLVEDGWLESRHGSGIYVAAWKADASSAIDAADRLLSQMLVRAREQGIAVTSTRNAMERWLAIPRPQRALLMEPDEELRSIVSCELKTATLFPISTCGLDPSKSQLRRSAVLCLPSKEVQVRRKLPGGCELIVLPVRSAPTSLASWLPKSREFLVAIVSRWPGFIDQARTMLLAAGFSEDALVLRDARKSRWYSGLETTAAILCDALTATNPRLPVGKLVIPFPILAESVKEQLAETLPL